MLQPEVGIKMQVQQGAVHIQQNGVDFTPGRHLRIIYTGYVHDFKLQAYYYSGVFYGKLALQEIPVIVLSGESRDINT